MAKGHFTSLAGSEPDEWMDLWDDDPWSWGRGSRRADDTDVSQTESMQSRDYGRPTTKNRRTSPRRTRGGWGSYSGS